MEHREEEGSAQGLKGRTDVLMREESYRENHYLDKRAGAQMWQVLDHDCEALRSTLLPNFPIC